jgi:hypothetical protein
VNDVQTYLNNKLCLLVSWLVGWSSSAVVKVFGPYAMIFPNVCVVIAAVMLWLPLVVKGFWAYGVMLQQAAVVMLLTEVLILLYAAL